MFKLSIHQSELVFEATYATPAFDLLRQNKSVDLHVVLANALSKYGLSLNDVGLQGSNTSFAELHIKYYLPRAGVLLRIWLEKLEIIFDLQRSVDGFPEEFANTVVAAMGKAIPEVLFSKFNLALAMHARIDGVDLSKYLETFVAKSPIGTGDTLGRGCVWYMSGEGDRLFSNLTVDVSAVVQNGLFVKIDAAYDGAKIGIDGLPDVYRAYCYQCLGALNLELENNA